MKIKLFKQKTFSTVPTIWGRLLIFAVFALGFFGTITNCGLFLSKNKPVSASVLVVEGWAPDYALVRAAQEFRDGHYALLVATGGPLENGMFLSEYKTWAQVAGATFKKLGVDTNALVVLPSSKVRVDRTYAAACQVRGWIQRSCGPITSINLFSVGAHTRRSGLLYRQALGKNVMVGTICCPDKEYDVRRWWTSSQGFRMVSDEIIAYLYARFIFSVH
jgi:uncharacterized SAM-binding protein YcdF (DUF218 family)